MVNKKDLRGGIVKMREVAQLLNEWANDLEATFQGQEADEWEVSGAEPGPAEKKKRAAKPVCPESAAVKDERKALTLPEVRSVLAEKCAAGFGAQVKGLIESYGASTLKEVPAEKYEELLEAVKGLGDADAG